MHCHSGSEGGEGDRQTPPSWVVACDPDGWAGNAIDDDWENPAGLLRQLHLPHHIPSHYHQPHLLKIEHPRKTTSDFRTAYIVYPHYSQRVSPRLPKYIPTGPEGYPNSSTEYPHRSQGVAQPQKTLSAAAVLYHLFTDIERISFPALLFAGNHASFYIPPLNQFSPSVPRHFS